MRKSTGNTAKMTKKETLILIFVSALLILCCAIVTTLMMKSRNPRTVAEAKSLSTDAYFVDTKPHAVTTMTTASAAAVTTTVTTTVTTAAETVPHTYNYADPMHSAEKITAPATETQTAKVTETSIQTVTEASAAVTEGSASKAAEPAPQVQPEAQQPAAPVSSVTYRGKTFSTSQQELNLSGFKMKNEDLPALKELAAKFPNLQKIVLCDCGLSNETLAAFQNEMNGVRVVWRVKLGTQWSLRTDAVAFSVLIMNYKHVRMTSKDLEVLKYCPDLLALDLGHQALTDLSKIPEYLPDLRLLIIADNQVSDLSPLANLKHLHYLEIFVNRVKDLSPLAGLRELVDVNISYNPISDITPLLNSPMMQRIWLESTKVSQSGVDQLRAAYPNAKVVNIGKGSVDQGWRYGNARYEQMMNMWFNNYYGSEFQKYDDLAVTMGLRG